MTNAILLLLAILFGGDAAIANDHPNNQRQININSADAKVIATLNGIGEKRAQAIVEYREHNGNFNSLEGLTAIRGITPKSLATIMEKNKDRLTISQDK